MEKVLGRVFAILSLWLRLLLTRVVRPSSLIATIRTYRPDLLTERGEEEGYPIPATMPPKLAAKREYQHYIEDIGEPTMACHMVKMNIDPKHWLDPLDSNLHQNPLPIYFTKRWLFEKYDGIRGFWNPLKQAFYSRYGNVLNMPQEIVDSMPRDIFLDGEIWLVIMCRCCRLSVYSHRFGRDNFQEATKISYRVSHSDIDWSKFRYMVFDIPNHEGTYQQRYSILCT